MEGAITTVVETGFICGGETESNVHLLKTQTCLAVAFWAIEAAALHSGLCPASVGAHIGHCVTSLAQKNTITSKKN